MAAIDKAFRATLEESPAEGGRAYVVLPDTATFFGTAKGRVTVTGMVDGRPFISSFKPCDHERPRLPVNAAVRSAIQKRAGDTVTVFLEDRLDR